MNNLFNKRQRVPSLFEEAMLGRIYDEPGENENNKPKTNVVVNTTREWYGKNSTVSTFIATAYNEQGEKIDSMKGYFLEPHVNYDSARIANSDKAIMYGTYNVIPKAELENRINKRRRDRGKKDVHLRFDWYVDKVPGRSGIAIHGGTNGDDTLGCLLPGDTLEYKEHDQDYTIKTLRQKRMNFLISSNNTGNKELR